MVAAPKQSATMNAVLGKDETKQPTKVSKRRSRSLPNDKNKWPQHPKIQSMDRREKAYVRVAGLGSSKAQQEAADPKLDLMSPEAKFLRLLGGTDQRIRHAAVKKLKAYLVARCDINNEGGGLSENDLLKLWKGLWHTLYMADKVPVQDELSKRLAELLWCVAGTDEEDEYAGQAYMQICEEEDNAAGEEEGSHESVSGEEEGEEEVESMDSQEDDGSGDGDGDGDDVGVITLEEADIPHCRGAHLASLFIRTFLRTLRREWGRMDKYRVDKFYTLLRLYIHEMYKYMSRRHWNLGIIRLFNDCVFEEVLSKTPNGLRYHLIDICLEELAKVNAKGSMPLTEATFLDVLEPYLAMAQTGASDGSGTIQQRVVENVLEKFLNTYSFVGTVAQENDDSTQDESLVFDQVHVETIGNFIFELASDPETKDHYRKSLYEMHKMYLRRIKEVGTDVVLHEIESQPESAEMFIDDEGEAGACKSTCKDTSCGGCDVVEESLDATPESNAREPSPKKSKSKLSKKKERAEKKKAAMSAKSEEEEEEMVISLAEQKEEKTKRNTKSREPRQKKKKIAKTETEDSSNKEGSKRVKFTKVNKSRSYKSSIKGLNTNDPPKTAVATPEKSILRKKGNYKSSHESRKVSRRKASSYF